MWNLTTLDTSATTNRRSYFRSAVTRKASSTARETALSPPSNFYPHASARHRHAHAPHPVPHHTPHYMPHHTPARATHPTTPPHHTPPRHAPHRTPASHPTAPRARTTVAPTPSPPQSRMQFPHGTNRRTLKNLGISTIRLQNLKHSQGNCMRNCCARGRQGPADHTPPSPYQSRT